MQSRIGEKLPLLVLTLLFSTAIGRAATTLPAIVHVDLVDPSSGPSVKTMMIMADAQRIKAGPVTFVVSNNSKELIHEMIVVSVEKPDAPLPYDKKDDKVNKSKIADLGEASDLKPEEKRTLQLTLKPGAYLLLCNQPDHFMSGMKTSLVVTP